MHVRKESFDQNVNKLIKQSIRAFTERQPASHSYAYGELPELPRGDIIFIAKSEKAPKEKIYQLLGIVGLAGGDEEEIKKVESEVEKAAEESETIEWLRAGRNYDPQAIVEIREKTQDFEEVPLIQLAKRIVIEHHNHNNLQVEFIARNLVANEVVISS